MLRLSTVFLVAVGVFVALTSSSAQQSDVRTRIQQKQKQVEAAFPKWVQSGGNPRRLEPLTQELDRDMKAGRFAEAEKTLDRILAVLRGEPGAEAAIPETVVERVQRKA